MSKRTEAAKLFSCFAITYQSLLEEGKYLLEYRGEKNEEYSQKLSDFKALLKMMDKEYPEFKESALTYLGG
jgi:hypothetical protein